MSNNDIVIQKLLDLNVDADIFESQIAGAGFIADQVTFAEEECHRVALNPDLCLLYKF